MLKKMETQNHFTVNHFRAIPITKFVSTSLETQIYVTSELSHIIGKKLVAIMKTYQSLDHLYSRVAGLKGTTNDIAWMPVFAMLIAKLYELRQTTKYHPSLTKDSEKQMNQQNL